MLEKIGEKIEKKSRETQGRTPGENMEESTGTSREENEEDLPGRN